MCHSENRHDDKQNKNRWSFKLRIHTVVNRIKTVGANRAPVTVTKTLGMYIPETL